MPSTQLQTTLLTLHQKIISNNIQHPSQLPLYAKDPFSKHLLKTLKKSTATNKEQTLHHIQQVLTASQSIPKHIALHLTHLLPKKPTLLIPTTTPLITTVLSHLPPAYLQNTPPGPLPPQHTLSHNRTPDCIIIEPQQHSSQHIQLTTQDQQFLHHHTTTPVYLITTTHHHTPQAQPTTLQNTLIISEKGIFTPSTFLEEH